MQIWLQNICFLHIKLFEKDYETLANELFNPSGNQSVNHNWIFDKNWNKRLKQHTWPAPFYVWNKRFKQQTRPAPFKTLNKRVRQQIQLIHSANATLATIWICTHSYRNPLRKKWSCNILQRRFSNFTRLHFIKYRNLTMELG